MDHFKARIYTLRQYRGDLAFIARNLPGLVRAFRNRDIPRSFAEKIMLVVTAVNGCRYCAWFHARQALASGMTDREIADMLELQFHASASERELPALLYAQQYAETDRNPDRDMLDRLTAFYGTRTAADIILYVRAIFFGNLTGNTFDAFLSRMRGAPAENGSALFECLFFIINVPILFPIYVIINRRKTAAESS